MSNVWAQSLIDVMRVLASPASAQLQYLRELGGASPDELGLSFDDYYLVARDEFSADAQRVLDELNSLFDEMSGPSSGLWSETAVKVAPEWSKVRQLSTEFLSRAAR